MSFQNFSHQFTRVIFFFLELQTIENRVYCNLRKKIISNLFLQNLQNNNNLSFFLHEWQVVENFLNQIRVFSSPSELCHLAENLFLAVRVSSQISDSDFVDSRQKRVLRLESRLNLVQSRNLVSPLSSFSAVKRWKSCELLIETFIKNNLKTYT